MNISDFARSRGVEPQAVCKYINRHPEIQKYTHRNGKSVELDPDALEMLDPVYPLPKPIQIIEGIPHEEHEALMRRFSDLQDFVIQMQDDLFNAHKKIEMTKSNQKLLEKDNQIQAKQLDEMQQRLDSANDEIKRLKSRSLFQRIINS